MRCRQHVDVLARPRRLGTAFRGTDETFAEGVGADGCGQRAGHGADRSVERQLADGGKAFDGIRRDRLHRHHEPEHDRQIEVAAFLRQVGGRQIDGDVLERKPETDSV